MSGYIGSKAAVVSSGAERKKTFAITATTTSLTGLSYTPGFVHVFHNGIRLVDGTDYTATSGTSITLTNAAESGDEVVVVSYASFQTSDTVSASAGGTFSNDVNIDGDLTVDTNTLFVDSANNRVGVGTSSPDRPVHLSSTGTRNYFKAETTGTTNSSESGFEIKTPSSNWLVNSLGGTDALIFYDLGNISERMRIDSAGRVTMPYQPAFLALRTDGGQTTAAGSTFAFNATGFNTGNHYSTSTYRFTAPVNGVYHFSAGVYRNSAGERWGFAKNGTYFRSAIPFVSQTTNERGNSISITEYLSAGDYVEIREWSNQSFAWWGSHSWFSGYLIG